VATVIIALFDPLSRHAFGDQFMGAVAYNSLNGVAGSSTEGTLGVAPYLPVLAGILADNIVLAVVISAAIAIWVWFWIPGFVAYCTRSMIAWSFDRVAPDRLGYVSERFHTPVVAIWTFISASVVLIWFIAYRHFAFLTFVEVLVVVWGFTLLAAVIFPYRRPAMYQASPVARLRVFGMPLMAVTGALGVLVYGLIFYLLWTDPVAAGPMIKKPLPLEFWITVGTIAAGALWYLGVKAYRRRAGIDIRLAFQQIPIE
jgi:amino acid transporter